MHAVPGIRSARLRLPSRTHRRVGSSAVRGAALASAVLALVSAGSVVTADGAVSHADGTVGLAAEQGRSAGGAMTPAGTELVASAHRAASSAAQTGGDGALRVVDGFGGALGGMALVGDRVVIGLGTRVTVRDVADPRLGEVTEGPAGSSLATWLVAAGKEVVVAGRVGTRGGILRWLAIDGAQVREVGSLARSARPTALAARGGVAWWGLGRAMTVVARGEDPVGGAGEPGGVTVVGGLQLGADVHALHLGPEIGLALLGSPASGQEQALVVLEASDPRSPRELARLRLTEPTVDVLPIGDHLLLAGVGRGYVVDLTRPDRPRIVAGDPAVAEETWWPNGLISLCAASDGTMAWVGDARPGLMAFDLSTPERPRLLYSEPLAEAAPGCRGLKARGDRLLRQDGSGQLQVFDTAGRSVPELVGRAVLPTFDARSVAAAGTRGWALGNAGSALAERGRDGLWERRALPPSWRASDLAVRGETLHMLTASGLQPYDIAGAGAAAARDPITLPPPESGRYGHLVSDGRSLVVGGAKPLQVLGEGGALREIGGRPGARVLALRDDRVWGVEGPSEGVGMWWADLGDERPVAQPVPLPTQTVFAAVEAMALTPRRAFIGLSLLGFDGLRPGVEAWRLDENGLPAESLDRLDVPGTSSAMVPLEGERVALGWRLGLQPASDHGGVRVMASLRPDVLDEVTHLDVGAPVYEVAAGEGHLWLAAGQAGVLVVERSGDAGVMPTPVAGSPTPTAGTPMPTVAPRNQVGRSYLPVLQR